MGLQKYDRITEVLQNILGVLGTWIPNAQFRAYSAHVGAVSMYNATCTCIDCQHKLSAKMGEIG